MSELEDLYQELVLDHSRAPRNRRRLASFTHRAEGFNPLCGDRVELTLQLEGDTVRDAAFEGQGCAIATASSSLLTQAVKGRSEAEVRALWTRLHRALTGEVTDEEREALGKLAALTGVRAFPVRVKCVSLAWHTLVAALEGTGEPVSTESSAGGTA